MYAIARIAGKQFRIEPDGRLKVPRLPLEVDSSFEISEILFAADGDRVHIGEPLVKGARAIARVLSHGRDPKIIVFRKKRRKGFKVTKGHRQDFTLLQVEKIEGLTAKPKEAAELKAAKKPKATPKLKAAAKPKTSAKPKVAAKPKTADKRKAAAKSKTAVKKKTAKSNPPEAD